MKKIAIIGAGAAGTFCATQLRRALPDAVIDIYEAGPKALAKVAVTGGGRCNLTNTFEGIGDLSEAYPRGHRLIRRLFKVFDHDSCQRWFEAEGVRLVRQDDFCIFPCSQDAMEIVRTLLRGCLGCNIHLGTRISSIRKEERFILEYGDGKKAEADIVVVTAGGYPRSGNASFLKDLGIEMVESLPSLFTFTIDDPVTEMMGTVVEATASLPGTKFKAHGPLLITDWGMSGPAILKLSSYAARHLALQQYRTPLLVNWINGSEEDARTLLSKLVKGNEKKLVTSVHPDEIPSRLWSYLVAKSGLRTDIRWGEVGKTGLNKFCNTLINDSYQVCGKTKFKDEFVTCGGVSLQEVNQGTMESKRYPGLYFAGEVLDIDAITGGFNLQAAWTTGYVAANSIIDRND
ncbi:MAG: aminoacetone oxidase family FAD-binding enzyme [Bacteroidales bacterium]|nr:aminoacetone oxidase family FAD-binding enzyme [Bacteroidales bacterium]